MIKAEIINGEGNVQLGGRADKVFAEAASILKEVVELYRAEGMPEHQIDAYLNAVKNYASGNIPEK